MPLTVWRIGRATMQCNNCGEEASSDARPNAYAALLASGWTERFDEEGSKRWLGAQPPALFCPACSVDA